MESKRASRLGKQLTEEFRAEKSNSATNSPLLRPLLALDLKLSVHTTSLCTCARTEFSDPAFLFL